MTDTFTAPAPVERPDIPRDRLGRPMVMPLSGDKPVAYTRCTTFVGAIEDTWNISRWTQRMVLRGLAGRDDIRAAVLDTSPEDKKRLDELCEEAKEAGGGNDASRWGTYMHKVTEAADRGEDPGAIPLPLLAVPRDPLAYVPDLAAYTEATQPLRHLAIEQFTVNDQLLIGGTPDRVVEYQGERYIADLKTGGIDFGTLKIAAQLAVYARSTPYDIATGERLPAHGASTERGIIIHLPAGTGTCTLYWVDLLAGWDAVRLCRDVRAKRTQHKFRTLTQRLDAAGDQTISLATKITNCIMADQVRALWRQHADAWTDDLTDLAKAHIARLSQ